MILKACFSLCFSMIISEEYSEWKGPEIWLIIYSSVKVINIWVDKLHYIHCSIYMHNDDMRNWTEPVCTKKLQSESASKCYQFKMASKTEISIWYLDRDAFLASSIELCEQNFWFPKRSDFSHEMHDLIGQVSHCFLCNPFFTANSTSLQRLIKENINNNHIG